MAPAARPSVPASTSRRKIASRVSCASALRLEIADLVSMLHPSIIVEMNMGARQALVNDISGTMEMSCALNGIPLRPEGRKGIRRDAAGYGSANVTRRFRGSRTPSGVGTAGSHQNSLNKFGTY